MADWGKPFSTSFRFMRVDRASGNEVERIMNIKNGGCIERNQDKDYTTGQVDYSGVLDLGADLLRVYLDADFGGPSVGEALGTFVVSAPKRTRRGVNSTGTAGLSGRLSEVAEDEFDAPFTVAAGTMVVPYVVKLLKAAGFADVIADGSDYKLAQDWTLGIDSGDMRLSKRLAACNALLDVADFRAVDEDAYGRPVLRKYREPQDRPVSMTLREGAGARFINEVVDELDRSGVANVVRCGVGRRMPSTVERPSTQTPTAHTPRFRAVGARRPRTATATCPRGLPMPRDRGTPMSRLTRCCEHSRALSVESRSSGRTRLSRAAMP